LTVAQRHGKRHLRQETRHVPSRPECDLATAADAACALAYLLGLTIAALVLARRRWPVAVLVASAATLQVYFLLD
jgi:hypothetical protein